MDYGEFDATRLTLRATLEGGTLDWDRDFHLVSPAFTVQQPKIEPIQPPDEPHE